MANSPGTAIRKHFESDPVLQGFEKGTLSWGNHMQDEEDRLERERAARHARGEYTPRATPPGSPPRETVPAYLPPRRAPSPQRRPQKFGFQPRGYRQGPNHVPQWLRAPPPGYSRRRSPSRSPPRYYSRRRSPSGSPPRYSRRRSPSRSPPRYSRRRSPSRSPSRGRNNRYSRRRSPSRSPSRGRSSRYSRRRSPSRSVNSFGRRLSYSPPRRTNTARRGRGPRFFNQATGTYRSLSPTPTRE